MIINDGNIVSLWSTISWKENSSKSAREIDVAKCAPPQNKTKKLTYSVKEAATALGVSQKSIRRLIQRGLLRSSVALRKILIPAGDVESLVLNTLAE